MKTVWCGMSGGVDSSVSAYLLREQGYRVVGVYMKNWSEDLPGMKCPWAQDLADAKRVAVRLGLDFLVLDFEQEYRERVVDYMISEYRAGRAPNPDIMCNQEMKFRLFADVAFERGADFIAMGHYADVRDGMLARPVDEVKDQTYFLYRAPADVLARTIFPLSGMRKDEVKTLAAELGLSVAGKKESMGVCMVGKMDILDFLQKYIPAARGEIIEEESGKLLGEHSGAAFYTVGQRHGLEVGGGLPYYVARKDMEKNILYVTRNLNNEALWRGRIRLHDVILHDNSLLDDMRVRVRHRGELLPAKLVVGSGGSEGLENLADSGSSRNFEDLQELKGSGDLRAVKDSEGMRAEVIFEHEQRTVPSGQSVVFYGGEGYKTCFGGGIVL